MQILSVYATEQQSFIDAPRNTTVVQGQTVILRCSVANRKGRVQWTKDGFALGISSLLHRRLFSTYVLFPCISSTQLCLWYRHIYQRLDCSIKINIRVQRAMT